MIYVHHVLTVMAPVFENVRKRGDAMSRYATVEDWHPELPFVLGIDVRRFRPLSVPKESWL